MIADTEGTLQIRSVVFDVECWILREHDDFLELDVRRIRWLLEPRYPGARSFQRSESRKV